MQQVERRRKKNDNNNKKEKKIIIPWTDHWVDDVFLRGKRN